LGSTQAFAVILSLMILTFGIAAIGVVAWLVSRSTNPRAPMSTPALGVLAALIALVLGAAVYVGAQARGGERLEKSSGNSITNLPNNTGIITQGQSGNNVIITAPSQPPAPCRDFVDATYTIFAPGSEPKTTLFTPLPNDELKKRAQTTVIDLRNFASDYRKK
jgi:hypothetical protein